MPPLSWTLRLSLCTGNPHSRVNSTEPAYRIPVHREHANTNHSFFYEIIDDIRRLTLEFRLNEGLHLRATVTCVGHFKQRNGVLCACGTQLCDPSPTPHGFQLAAKDLMVLCTNRRLGLPRQIVFPGEDSFAGLFLRGLGGDNVDVPWAGTPNLASALSL